MTQNESIVFKAAMEYLERFGNPPPYHAAESLPWWEKAADALAEFGNKHYNHPLALQLGVAIYEYIEIKAKAKENGNVQKQ